MSSSERPDVESIRESIREIDQLVVDMLMRTERRIGFCLGLFIGMGLMGLAVFLNA